MPIGRYGSIKLGPRKAASSQDAPPAGICAYYGKGIIAPTLAIVYLTDHEKHENQAPDRPIPHEDLIRTVATALAHWEDTGELYGPFAARLVDFILHPSEGLRKRVHESGDILAEN